MSEIKALDKLREWSHHSDSKWLLDSGNYVVTNGHEPENAIKNIGESLRELADEIQAEVDECYMRLPFDADGVPIRPGDEVYRPDDGVRMVEAVGKECFVAWDSSERRYCIYSASRCLHHKPRTIEDVLHDFGWECVNNCGADPNDIASCADEIRELLGGAE